MLPMRNYIALLRARTHVLVGRLFQQTRKHELKLDDPGVWDYIPEQVVTRSTITSCSKKACHVK